MKTYIETFLSSFDAFGKVIIGSLLTLFALWVYSERLETKRVQDNYSKYHSEFWNNENCKKCHK